MEITGEITSLAFGGKGILRANNLVVFVPFAAPGERVRVRITKEHKRFAEGELIEILTPSPERLAPSCTHYGRCGGCQLQHITYAAQLQQKQTFVTDALQRIGKITLDKPVSITCADPIWGYRRHIHLSLSASEGSACEGRYQAGYVCIDGATHLPTKQCPIFLPGELDMLTLVQELIPVEGEARLGIYKNAKQFILAYDFSGKFPSNLQTIAHKQLGGKKNIQGIVARGRNKTKIWGDIGGKFAIDGLQIAFTPLAFVQNHPKQSANIYRNIVALAGQTVLDLYCGIGALSLLLAQKGRAVTGVESSAEAIRLAILNASANDLEATFICEEVAKIAQELLKKNWDTVVVNPPRTGLDPNTRETLLQARPRQILYLSCMPATLARDIASAQQAGYRVHSCQAYDMFPQTTHVETLVELRL